MVLVVVVFFSLGPYSCLFSRMCAAYADVELLDLIYLICSLNLVSIALPDCPTYTLLHVLHFNLYIPLGSLCFGLLLFSCFCIVLVARKLIFIFVCLNKLVIRLISGLWYVTDWEALYMQVLCHKQVLIDEQQTGDPNPLFQMATITYTP